MEKFEYIVLDLTNQLESVVSEKKSLIELNITSEQIDEAEDALFKIRFSEYTFKSVVYPELFKKNITIKESVGLLFLAYITYRLRSKITYTTLWSYVFEGLNQFEILHNTYFRDNYFDSVGQPNDFLKECLRNASERFNLRNSYGHMDELQHRNTVLLQIGLLDNFNDLTLWLSGHYSRKTIGILLDQEDGNYSATFAQGWRALRRYRDNLLNKSQSKALLSDNVWFKPLDLENLLKAAKRKLSTAAIMDEDIDNIFKLEQIQQDGAILRFIINAEDLYALNLEGSDYVVYINGVYKSQLLRDENKILKLNSRIILEAPKSNVALIEIKNEDSETVYQDEIMLFDFQDQVLIFDDQGQIHKDIFKKLSRNHRYCLLFDSDLDCNLPESRQIEYFDGYATLVPCVTSEDKCVISYDGEELFSLNYSDNVQRPDWINKLVLFAADTNLVMNEDINLHLKVYEYDDQEEPLHNLPDDAEILRWTYNGNYIDKENIEDFSVSVTLDSDMVFDRRHHLFIKYRGKTYTKSIRAALYDMTTKFYTLYQKKNADAVLIEKNEIVDYDDLLNSKMQIAYFKRDEANDTHTLKGKASVFGSFRPNNIFQIKQLPCFGDTVGVSSHILNSPISHALFRVKKQGIVNSFDHVEKKLILKQVPEYFKSSDIVLLDSNYEIKFYKVSNFEIQGNTINIDQDVLGISVIYEGNYLGSYVNYKKIDIERIKNDIELIKFLRLAYMPILLRVDGFRMLASDEIMNFLNGFMSDTYKYGAQKVLFDFSEINKPLEHILYEVTIDRETARRIVGESIYAGWTEKLLNMPIFLTYLLRLAHDKNKTELFLSKLEQRNIVEPNTDRDDHFIKQTITNLLHHEGLTGMQKHNLKISMHYKYANFYLKLGFEKLLIAQQNEEMIHG